MQALQANGSSYLFTTIPLFPGAICLPPIPCGLAQLHPADAFGTSNSSPRNRKAIENSLLKGIFLFSFLFFVFYSPLSMPVPEAPDWDLFSICYPASWDKISSREISSSKLQVRLNSILAKPPGFYMLFDLLLILDQIINFNALNNFSFLMSLDN